MRTRSLPPRGTLSAKPTDGGLRNSRSRTPAIPLIRHASAALLPRWGEGGTSHEVHPLLAEGPPRDRRQRRRGRRGHDHGRPRGRARRRSGREARRPSRSPASSRPCSTPTPTACASARSRPRTAARRSSAARPTRARAWSPSTPRSGPTSRARASRWSPGRCAASSPTACSARPPSWRLAEESDGILELADGHGGRRAGRRGAWPRGGDRLRGDAEPPRLAGRGRHRPRPGRRRASARLKDLSSTPVPGALPLPDRDPARRLRTPARPSPGG